MIQRIQTVYLLLVSVFYVVTLFFPFASFMTVDGVEYTLSFRGLTLSDSDGWNWTMTTMWFSLIVAVIPAIALVSVNLYRKRMLQIRLSVFNIVLMLGSYGLFFVVKALIGNEIEYDVFSMNWTCVVPAICSILTYLAIRAIGKDEVLVRSLDRIR